MEKGTIKIKNVMGLTLEQISWMKQYFVIRDIEIGELKYKLESGI